MPCPLRVFLCHASQDKPAVRELYNALKSEGWIDPWLDKAKILPGQDWEMVIEKAVEASDVVIICLSSQSVTKEGFVQREIRYAYDLALEKPEDTIFLIPLRLDDCPVPRKLRTFHWVDYFGAQKKEAYSDLLEALQLRYDQKMKLEAQEEERKEAEKKTKQEAEELARRLAAEKAAREKAERESIENAKREERERETKKKLEAERLRVAREKEEHEQRERDAAEKAKREAAQKAELARKNAEERKRSLETVTKTAQNHLPKLKIPVLVFALGFVVYLLWEGISSLSLHPGTSPTLSLPSPTFPQLLSTTVQLQMPTSLSTIMPSVETVAANCDDAVYVSDVTIPDGTTIPAGQSFTKTWKVSNIGSCAWTATYQLTFVSGDSLGGRATPIKQAVNPGQSVDVSVVLTSSSTSGNITSRWKLTNDKGQQFGDDLTVIIKSDITTTGMVTSTQTLGIGSTMISDKDGMTMVYVPAGEFTMGSENGNSEEKPVHTVYLDAFWIDQTEVTNAMFASFVANTGYETDAHKRGASYVLQDSSWVEVSGADWQHPSGARSDVSGKDTHPVTHVSWNDATAYCEWAGRELPTEAQWEKAVRGTDGRIYPWGNDFDGSIINFCDINCSSNWADKNYDDGYAETSPVKSYPDSIGPYGAYDMAGNVWEWVNDWYSETYYQDSPLSNPLGPDTGEYRVLRGGSWSGSNYGVRSATRLSGYSFTYDFVGFRCSHLP